MKQYNRLPRKLKKQIGPSWREYLKEQNTLLERDHHLDIIFTKDYDDGRSIVQEIFNQ